MRVIGNHYWKEINKIAIPLILSSLTSVCMGLMDQAFVGHISVYAYAGVGLVCSCINSLVGVLGAFSIVFNICGSRIKGEKAQDDLNEEFSISCLLCGGIGIFLFLLFQVFCYPVLKIGFGLQGDTLKEAVQYLRIFSLTIPLNLLIFIYNGVFKIVRKTEHILVVSLFANAMNIVLDYVLIFGKFGFPAMGTAGAGIGTVTALAVNLGIYGVMARQYIHFGGRIQGLKRKIKEKLIFSLPFLGQEAMEDIVFVVGMNMLVARMGTVELSVYNLILQIISIIQMPMFGYTTAAITLVSETYGRKDEKEIPRIKNDVIGLMSLWFLVLAAGILFYSRPIIQFISEEPLVLERAVKCLPIAVLIQIVNYGINVEKSVLQSIGYSAFALEAAFLANVLTVLAMWIFAEDLMGIYVMLGFGYLLMFGILYWKDRQCILKMKKEICRR